MEITTNKQNVERGSASILLDLTDGTITMTHGTDNVTLHQVEDAEQGSWDKIIEAIRNIKSV